MRRLSFVMVLGVLMTLTVGVSSSSAASGGTSSSDGVLYADCRFHSYDYDIAPDYSEWDLEIDLIGPDGTSVDSDYHSSYGDSTAGSGRFQFCGYERAGRYEIEGTLTSYDYDYNAYVTELPVSTFRMREPRSRTRLGASDRTPHYNEVVRLRSTAVEEKPRGYFEVAYGAVKLQVKTPDGWANVKQSKTYTNDRGVAVWRYRWNLNRTVRLRALTLLSSDYTDSNSKPVSIDTTAHWRVAVGSTARGLARVIDSTS